MRRAPRSEVPDTILPVQYFDRTGASDTPEKRLMFAVLLDAILQLRRGDGGPQPEGAGTFRPASGRFRDLVISTTAAPWGG
jgi:hypothetical protein